MDIKLNSLLKISIDIGLNISKEHYWRICPHPSDALKITAIGAGVIDSDFRGNIFVILFNFMNKFYQINIGGRIVQIIFEKTSTPLLQEVYTFKDKTERRTDTSGSTSFWNK